MAGNVWWENKDMTKKKSSKPELIEDKELDAASGGLLPAVKPTELKIRTTDPAEPTAGRDFLLNLDGVKLQQRP